MRLRTTIVRNIPILFLIILLLPGCADHGLSPSDSDSDKLPGFGGVIRVKSQLPPSDSLRDLRVVAFRNYPPLNIVLDVASKKAVFTDTTIVIKGDISSYRIQNSDAIGEFKYVVVAQQFGPNIFTDWRVVGVYTTTMDVTKPSSISVPLGTFLSAIDIDVDFYNPPPQPF
jgi:hypothetical protein